MTSVFLSYARDDDKAFVKRLHDDLTAAGFDGWFDLVNMPSRNLTFHQEIRDAIAQRDRVLLVVGPQAVASEYVRQEWEFAWFEAEKVVTPILRQGDLPIAIDELKLLHCEDFRDDAHYTVHLKELIRILKDPVPPLGKLIGVPSLPPHYLSRADRLIPLRDAVRSGLDSPAPLGGETPAASVSRNLRDHTACRHARHGRDRQKRPGQSAGPRPQNPRSLSRRDSVGRPRFIAKRRQPDARRPSWSRW